MSAPLNLPVGGLGHATLGRLAGRRINVELFSCAGGIAEGFRRAGVGFDLVVDFEREHCDSYEANLGHRPVCMDVRDLLRLVQSEALQLDVDLLVADPPCTPWSHAGKRLGVADPRDMIEVTCELIRALRPRRYLLANVPGLDDAKNMPVVQRTIGALTHLDYCTADYARLDAADFGVPQHRVRPFWFGHREGRCVRWPVATHCDPARLLTRALPGMHVLEPWVSCRDALAHLGEDAGGRVVKRSAKAMRWPWDRPATAINTRGSLAPPGHHDEAFAIMSLPGTVALTEEAATILQGFPPGWLFAGATQKARWSQIGQSMPPPLAEAVARSIVAQGASS